MKFNNLALGTITLLPIFLTTFLDVKNADATTRIAFARGSYCGSYSGNFSNGREFVLNLGRGQTFSSRNIGGGTQYDIYVTGFTGRVFGTKVASDQINYQIPRKGDYRIYIESSTSYSSVEFCAY